MKSPAPSVLIAIFTIAFSLTLSATTITFDDAGYITGGKLHGSSQPSGITWSGQAGSEYFEVQPEGVDESDAVVTMPMTEESSNLSTAIDPSLELTEFDSNSSVVEVSFQVRFIEEPTDSHDSVAAIWFGQVGSDGSGRGVRIGFLADGMLRYIDGKERITIQDFAIRPEDSWVTISIQMNYKTKEYSLSINGQPRGGLHSFLMEEDTTHAPKIMIQNMITPNHRRLAFDNFIMEIVPNE